MNDDDFNYERLRQIDRLFERRWEVFVVASLAGGPRRFGELAYEVSLHTGTKVSDSSLTTIKNRLVRAGVLAKTVEADGHPVYALTTRGRRTATILKAMTQALDDCDGADGEGPDSPQAA